MGHRKMCFGVSYLFHFPNKRPDQDGSWRLWKDRQKSPIMFSSSRFQTGVHSTSVSSG